MRKKALSPIIATVLLIALGIALATLVVNLQKNFISNLSPNVNCDAIVFRAEFTNSQTLNIVNIGTQQIEGIVIKEKTNELLLKETIETAIAPGQTKEVSLQTNLDNAKTFVLVPMISGENTEQTIKVPCPDNHGNEIAFS